MESSSLVRLTGSSAWTVIMALNFGIKSSFFFDKIIFIISLIKTCREAACEVHVSFVMGAQKGGSKSLLLCQGKRHGSRIGKRMVGIE